MKLDKWEQYSWIFKLMASALLTAGAAVQGQTVTTTVGMPANPFVAAVNAVTNRIYVVSGYPSQNVTVVDGATNSITATLPVGAPASGLNYSLAVNPVTNKIYVANSGSNNVTVIDGATNSVAATVATGASPASVTVNPVTNKVYVADSGSNNVTVIDGATNSATSVAVGTYPFAVGVNATTNNIYVANFGSNNITVINGASGSVAATIAVGTGPTSLAVNPLTNKIWVANQGSNNVTVIDGASNSVTATVAGGTAPSSVAINPVTNKIYVAAVGSSNFSYVTVIDGWSDQTTEVRAGPLGVGGAIELNPVTNKIYVPSQGTLRVIDGASNGTTTVAGIFAWTAAVNPVTNKIYALNFDNPGVMAVIDGATNTTTTVAGGFLPVSAAVNPVTNEIYVANNGSNSVTVIDGASGSTSTVAVGSEPASVAVNPATNNIYVANAGSNSVTVINGATNTVAANIAVGTDPVSLAVNPVTNKIYVANYATPGSVTVIDGATNATATAAVGSAPGLAAVNAVTNKIYLVNFQNNSVSVMDGATNSVTAVVGTGREPNSLAVNPATNKIYVANSGSNNVTVIDGATNSATAVAVGAFPVTVGVNPMTNNIYVANFSGGSITVINGASNTVTATIAVGYGPLPLAVNPVTNKIYVGNNTDGTVTEIDGASGSTTTITTDGLPYVAAVNPVTNKIYVPTNNNAVTVINEQQVQPIPLTVNITPLANNETYSPTPSFTFDPESTTYAAPDGVYFQVDTWQGAWSAASGSNPNYAGTLPSLQAGFHILYAYAVDGQEGASAQSDHSVSPFIGAMQAYGFLVLPPLATTMTVTASPVPGLYRQPVTLTAKVTASTGTPSGTVAFFFGDLLLGDGTLNINGVATVTTSVLPVGSDPIEANYSGNVIYLASSASVTEPIVALPPTVVSLSPSSGSGTAQTFSGVYADPNGTADLASVGMLFNSTLSAVKACAVYYYPSSNLLYLENDSGTGLTVGVKPGSSSTVSNSQCTLSGTGSSTSVSGNDLTMNAALIFSGTFLGPKNVYLAASDIQSTASGWLLEGGWTTASPPGSVKYTGLDTTTQGTWTGKYGADGYIIANDASKAPGYATVSLTGETAYTWAASTTDLRALQTASGAASRIASTYYSSSSFTINVNLTDANTHRIALYLLDWDGTARTETVSILDAASNAVLDTESYASFHNGEYAAWNVRGHVVIKVTKTGGTNAVVAGLFFDPLPAPSASAVFTALDTTTQGTWTGGYGADGYLIANDATAPPAYATVSLKGDTAYTWMASTTDVRALQTASGSSSRIASAYYSTTYFTIDVNLTDGNMHRIALYLLDWDSSARIETVAVLDAASNAVLSTEVFSSFHNGEYAVWKVKGHVLIQVSRDAASNAVVAGLFFDPPLVASATLLGTDSGTQGTWTGFYGSNGQMIANDLTNPPAFATVSLTGDTAYTWAASTTDVRALQTASGASTRIASVYESTTSFSIDLNLTDGKTHKISLYLLDWVGTSSSDNITILDATSNAVLYNGNFLSFHNGKYEKWNITGHVVIQVTGNSGSYALVSGIFFD